MPDKLTKGIIENFEAEDSSRDDFIGRAWDEFLKLKMDQRRRHAEFRAQYGITPSDGSLTLVFAEWRRKNKS